MLNIKGNVGEAIIFTDEIDSGSNGLIKALCEHPISENSKIRIMPDVHAGKGCCIGTTMEIKDKVIPNVVGVDIGCGVSVFKFKSKTLELEKLDKFINNEIPSGFDIYDEAEVECDILDNLKCNHLVIDKDYRSIGTLGGGNHFIEIDKGKDNSKYLIIHSGSRHLGVKVAAYYQEQAAKLHPEVSYDLAYLEGELLEDYLHDIEIIQEFARINRTHIANKIIKYMKFNLIDQFESIHNYIDTDNMILRKGAISAQKGEKLIIPINMRDGCLICEGKGNPEWNYSAPHGAGRVLSRSEAKESLTVNQFKKDMEGIFTTSVNKSTLDEAPGAYKSIEYILDKIGDTVEVKEIIKPIYNFKNSNKKER